MNILLVEDDPGDVELVRAYLEDGLGPGFMLTHASTLESGLDLLAEGRYDVALLDLNLPDSSGLNTYHDLHSADPDIPILILSGLDDLETSVMAVREGAQDYIIKGTFRAEGLARALRFGIERNRMRQDIFALSLTDELTKLHNRRGFMILAEKLMKTAIRLQRGAFLLFVDLDGMKAINDALGHRQGDQALCDAADMLRSTFRDVDVLARLGGDEFAIFGLEVQEGRAEPLTDRLRRTVSDFNSTTARPYALSISLGVAHLEPGADGSLEDLLFRADTEMYAQKKVGRKTRKA